jgi:hypothetical protein
MARKLDPGRCQHCGEAFMYSLIRTGFNDSSDADIESRFVEDNWQESELQSESSHI